MCGPRGGFADDGNELGVLICGAGFGAGGTA
jgi:hypothetical protein